MNANPLKSLKKYSRYIAELTETPFTERSTLKVWSVSKYTGIAEGEIFFKNSYRLRMREEIDFDEGIITSYGYEIYQGNKRLYWYDDFPHPNNPELTSTHPHHKHIHPDIKHNRIPAPAIKFSRPNLSLLIKEIEELATK